jgi:hypothetical protein
MEWRFSRIRLTGHIYILLALLFICCPKQLVYCCYYYYIYTIFIITISLKKVHLLQVAASIT